MNTESVQAAIDACSASGGGTALLAAGTYTVGTLYLKDYVILKTASPDARPSVVLEDVLDFHGEQTDTPFR